MSNETPVGEQESTRARSTRWSRVHSIWTVIILSLIPGVVIAAFRGHWANLHIGLQWATYAISAILIIAAVIMILWPGGKDA